MALDKRMYFFERRRILALTLAAYLSVAAVRRAHAEESIDFKYMWYQEDSDRIRVLTPAVSLQKQISETLSIRIEGVYNAISGASPTGAPPVGHSKAAPVYVSVPYSSYVNDAHANVPEVHEEYEEREDEWEKGEDDRRLHAPQAAPLTLAPRNVKSWMAKAGGTPSSGGSSSGSSSSSSSSSSGGSYQKRKPTAVAPVEQEGATTVPVAYIEDQRSALNIELTKIRGDHAISGGVSYSSESDYDSAAVSLRDAINFNQKNTTLTLGAAYTHDKIDAFVRQKTETKDTLDLLIGLTQVLGPRTLLNANFVLSNVSGYMDDQYKVVELNGKLVPEHRPDTKDKKVVFLSLLHLFKEIGGTAEVGYRYYDDSFGIRGDTAEFAWYQRLGERWILKPVLRYYQQGAADFYATTFSGSPQYYSADYRVSEMEALGYGLKAIWKPVDSLSLDLGVERYEQSGKDGITHPDVYPSAQIVTAGIRVWF